MTVSFDLHDHRHELKQLRDAGTTKLFANRSELACPACGEPFIRLFMSSQQITTFPENDGARFCILQQDETLYMFRH